MITMRISRRFPGYAALVASVVWALGTPPVASASCAEPPPLERALAAADVVFVGTVTALANDGRTATFRVEEVWKGTVGELVVVNGGPSLAELEKAAREGYGVATSVDRTYERGGRYLVVPFGASGDVLTDNACSSTQPYTDSLDRFRPAAAADPIPGREPASAPGRPGEASDGGGWSAIIVVVTALVAAGAVASLVARARRTTSSKRSN